MVFKPQLNSSKRKPITILSPNLLSGKYMNSPRFTFCIPNLNKMKYLPACIQSMLAQDCEDWHCVFVDGFSTDGSWEYMQQFASDPRFLILRGRQQGMYVDWNECLKYVGTDYFYFLTSDDTCFPSLVSTTIAALDAYPEIDACHFKFCHLDEDGVVIQSYEEILFEIYRDINQYAHIRSGTCEFIMHFVYRGIYKTITSLVFRRNLITKMKGFSNLYGSHGDYDWTMRLGLFTEVLYIPKLLATWRIYDGQATPSIYDGQASPNVGFPTQAHKAFLDIAKSNLDNFTRTDKALKLKKSINKNQVLSILSDAYASSWFREIISSKFRADIPLSLYIFFKKYPFYLLKVSLRRLTGNRLYPFQVEDSAKKLIKYYGLQWPPAKVETPQKILN
jgi:glycosyltransferase involved in cell wall biosynthesis